MRKEVVACRLSFEGNVLSILYSPIIFHACNCPSSTVCSVDEGKINIIACLQLRRHCLFTGMETNKIAIVGEKRPNLFSFFHI